MVYLTTRFFIKTVSISETVLTGYLPFKSSITRNGWGGYLGESSFGNEGVLKIFGRFCDKIIPVSPPVSLLAVPRGYAREHLHDIPERSAGV